jgi:hypothetical protein
VRPDVAATAWSSASVAEYLTEQRRPETKAADLLKGLARKMGSSYRKPVQAPGIAARLRPEVIEQLRPVLLTRLETPTGAL